MRSSDVPIWLPRLVRFFLVVAGLTVCNGPAEAQFFGVGQPKVTAVEQVTAARPGSRVSLVGSLKSEIRRAQYLFRDETGDIRVRIEREFWRGREVTSNTVLNLRGRVETDVRGRFIDVYYFQILE